MAGAGLPKSAPASLPTMSTSLLFSFSLASPCTLFSSMPVHEAIGLSRFLRTQKFRALSIRYTGIFTAPEVAPGVKGFVFRPTGGVQLFSYRGCVVQAALADRCGVVNNSQPLTTVTLENDLSRAARVNLAKRHI